MTDIPMPEDRYRDLIARREAREATAGAEVLPPDRAAPPAESSAFARELLAEAAGRPLESGELLVLFEEASLADLRAATGEIPRRAPRPVVTAAPAGAAGHAPLATPGLADLPPDVADPLAAGAWLLSDRVRRLLGLEASAAAWLRAAHAAMAGGLLVAADMVIGHVETWPERVEHLARLRGLHERDGGLAELGVRWCAGPRELPSEPPELRQLVPWPTELQAPDLARTLALARLTLPGEIAVFAVT